MKVVFLAIGKTSERYLTEGIQQFQNRLKHYHKLEWVELADVKGGSKLTSDQLKIAEGQLFMNHIQPGDTVVLLDEKGKQYSSRAFAAQFQKWMNAGPKRIVFVVGGAFGFSEEMYAKAAAKLSMSTMTTSHQLIRLIFVEQLYRAATILNNEPYHND